MPLKTWLDLMNDAGDAGKAFELLPDGPYDFVITEAVAGTTQTQKQKFNITANVESGPHAKRKVWHTFTISDDNPKALAWFFRNMSTLGLDAGFFSQNPSPEQVAAALVGKHFIGIVGNEVWPKDTGKPRNNIVNFNTPRPGGGGPGGPAGPGPSGPGAFAGPSATLPPPSAAPTPAPSPGPLPVPAIVAATPAPLAPPVATPAPAPAPAVDQPQIPAPAAPIPPAAADPWTNAAAQPGPAYAPAPVSQTPPPPAPPF